LDADALLRVTRRWVDPNGHTLSNRIWLARQRDRRAINLVLQRAYLAGARDETQVAQALNRYLRVPFRHQSDDSGAHYAARRLVRTEFARAQGVGVTDAVANGEGEAVQWHTSDAHKEPDICDDHASGSSAGLPPGVYRLGSLPTHPAHPHCECYLTVWSRGD
jgi:hypothetical protein